MNKNMYILLLSGCAMLGVVESCEEPIHVHRAVFVESNNLLDFVPGGRQINQASWYDNYVPFYNLKPLPRVLANCALFAAILGGASLTTKFGRDFAGTLVDCAVKKTAFEITTHGTVFVAGALVGGACVQTWNQRVEYKEIAAETRTKDFELLARASQGSGIQ